MQFCRTESPQSIVFKLRVPVQVRVSSVHCFQAQDPMSKSELPQSNVFNLRNPVQIRVSPFYCFQAQGLMSKSKSPQYIFVKLRVPGASQSLFSPFFLSVGVELEFEESGIWSNLPSVAVSDGLPSVHVSVSVLSLTLKNLESGPIFRQWLSVPGCQVSKSQCQY